MDSRKKHPILNAVFFVLELTCIPLILWWIPSSHLPLPGWAVAFMAIAAAAMSVHDDMKPWQKGVWMLIIGAFLITELRAINKDRAESNAQALRDRLAQETAFGAVRRAQDIDFAATAGALSKSIELSDQNFHTTMTQTDKLLLSSNKTAQIAARAVDAAAQSVEAVTGGKSYPRMLLSTYRDSSGKVDLTRFYLAAEIEGAKFVGSYRYEVVQLGPESESDPDQEWSCRGHKADNEVLLSDDTGPMQPLGPPTLIPLPFAPRSAGITRYRITMEAKNGRYTQCLDVRRNPKGGWDSKSVIWLGNFVEFVENKWPD
jgi:hypothetical protein